MNEPNQALERNCRECVSTFSMIKTVSVGAIYLYLVRWCNL